MNYGEEIGSNKDLRKGFRIYIFVFMAGYCLFNEDVTKLLMIVYHQFLDSIEVVILTEVRKIYNVEKNKN